MGSSRSFPRILATAARAGAVAMALGAGSLGVWRLAQGGFTGGGQQPLPSSLAALSADAPLIVYTEFGDQADAIWAAPAKDPARRTQIASIDHSEGFGINASLSPDGSKFAYTVLPPGLREANADSPAQLWVINVDGTGSKMITSDVDLLIAPVWAPDSASVVVRNSYAEDGSAGSFELLRVTLAGQETSIVAQSAALFPIAFSPDAALVYYAQVSPKGTDFGRVSGQGGAGQVLAHLSDDIARDWRLSPDGTRLAYLATRPDGLGFMARVLAIDTASQAQTAAWESSKLGALSALNGRSALVDEFSPIWHPNGKDLTVGRAAAGSPSGARTVAAADGSTSSLSSPGRGFDVPLSWSPDGAYLSVRSFEGDSATNPGRSHVLVTSSDGARREVSSVSDVRVLGWLR